MGTTLGGIEVVKMEFEEIVCQASREGLIEMRDRIDEELIERGDK